MMLQLFHYTLFSNFYLITKIDFLFSIVFVHIFFLKERWNILGNLSLNRIASFLVQI